MGIPNHDAELLFLCARTQHTPDEQARLIHLLEGVNDWGRLLKIAKKHGLGALVHQKLTTDFRDYIPRDELRKMQVYASCITLWNEAQIEELLRIIRLLEAEGIGVIPFKGPMLGAFVYGDVGRRTFADLDMLVRREHFGRVKELLMAEAYAPYRNLSGPEEEAFLRTQMGYEFVHPDRQVVIEVHWALLNRIHAFKLDPEEIWQRSHVELYEGVPVRRFSSEDLLIYLCAHGIRSFWEYAVWICDVAELIRHEPQLDWGAIMRRCRQLHSMRMLCSGLMLAHELFGAKLPAEALKLMQQDRAVARLVAWVKQRLFNPSDTPPSFYEKVRVHLMMRERFVDRLPYYAHLAKLVGHSMRKRILRAGRAEERKPSASGS